MDCFGTDFTLMFKPVITFGFQVLRDGLLRYRLYTHVQTCDNIRVQSATPWTAEVQTVHMSKPVITFGFKVLRHGLLRYRTLHMSKPVITFGFKVLRGGLLRYRLYTHVQTCDNIRVQSGLLRYKLYTCPNL